MVYIILAIVWSRNGIWGKMTVVVISAVIISSSITTVIIVSIIIAYSIGVESVKFSIIRGRNYDG